MPKLKKRVTKRPAAPTAAPVTKPETFNTSTRWRALVEGSAAGPIDPMHPDAGYYEARGGTKNRPFPLPARIVVTVTPDGKRIAEAWLDGQRVADPLAAWIYWRPITLERYESLRNQENKDGPGKRTDLKWQKPII